MKQEQLFELGFKRNIDGYYYNNNWEYQFNPYNNELVYYNDGFPEKEPLARIKDFEHLKQVLETL